MQQPQPHSGRIRTLVVDDSALVRGKICTLLESDQNLEIVGTAGDGREALAQADSLRPDLILMDIDMPEMNGWETTRVLLDRHPATRVIFVTVYDGDEIRSNCRDCGGHGFVSKESLFRDLPQEIRRVFFESPVASRQSPA